MSIRNMLRLVRRYALQLAALAAAAVFVVVLAVVALRPAAGGGGEAVRSPATARTTPTPDPRVDEVKAVARRYLVAFWESAKTGDTAAVDALTEKDSQAYDRAALNSRISKDGGHNFMAARVDIDEASWGIDITAAGATVAVSLRLYGHDAAWPSMTPREADHETTRILSKFGMLNSGHQWLINEFS